MAKEMLINVSEGAECRIALLENDRLEELYMERSSSTSHVGNIYKGRVTNVEASIQAAFIDFGLGRNGFLHISDLLPIYFGRGGEDIQESVGRKMAKRDRPPIQRCLRRGDEIIVQIIKEGIGTKGPTLTSYLSIPGRILVMMPGMTKLGVSRKIEDDPERRRLRTILDSLKPPKDVGFIIRTAGIGKSKTDIQRDFTYLTRLWMQIEKKRQSGPGPMELYTEGDLVTRTVRDVFTTDVDRIIIDNKDVASRVEDVIRLANPRAKDKVVLYDEPVPLFHKYGVEREIEQMYSRHVPLPSGGSLVIDSTEAVVAIDVNSGKFRDHKDAETTAFKTDMEAADEIPRQLKLRDLGGVIIVDFIDLRYERHRRELEGRLDEHFKNDKAKTKVLRMSQFGIIEITRQRMRPSLKRSIYFDCPHCKGSGLVKTPESMSLDVMRRLAIAVHDARVARVELSVCSEVAYYLQNRNRAAIANLEINSKKRILIRAEHALGLDEQKFELFDARDGLVYLEDLGMVPGDQAPPTHRRQGQQGRRDGRGGPRDARQQGRRPERSGRSEQAPPPRRHENVPDEDRFDLDSAVEAIEEREEERDEALSESDLRRSEPDSTPLAGPPQVLDEDEVDVHEVEEALEAGRELEFGEVDDDAERAEGDELPWEDEAEGEEVAGPEAGVDDEMAPPQRGEGRPDGRNDVRQGGHARGMNSQGGRGQGAPQQRNDRQRDDRQRNDRQRNDRQSNDRQSNDRGRDDRSRDNRQRDDRPRDNRQGGDRSRDNRPRDERQPGDRRPDPRRDARPDVRPDVRRDGGVPPLAVPGEATGEPADFPGQGEFAGEGEGGGRRRRRRRGGRGRGRHRREAEAAEGGAPLDQREPSPDDHAHGPEAGQEHDETDAIEASSMDDTGESADREDAFEDDRPRFEEPAERPQNQGRGAPPPRRPATSPRGSYADQFWPRDRTPAPAPSRPEPRADRPQAPRPPQPVEPREPVGNSANADRPAVEMKLPAEPVETAAPMENAAATPASESEAPAKRGSRSRKAPTSRRRKTSGADASADEAAGAEQAAEASPAPSRSKAKASGGRKPRAATSRSRRKGAAESDGAESAESAATGGKAPLIAEGEPAPRRPLRGAASDAAVKTAPADKHLIMDEPVLPEPPRRPRTVRDLDEIPDDLD